MASFRDLTLLTMTSPQRIAYRRPKSKSSRFSEDTQVLLKKSFERSYDQLADDGSSLSSRLTKKAPPKHYRNNIKWIDLDPSVMKSLQWGRCPEKLNNGVSTFTLEQEHEDLMEALMKVKERTEEVQQCLDFVESTNVEMAELFRKIKDIWNVTGEDSDMDAFWTPYRDQHLHQCIKLLKTKMVPIACGSSEANPRVLKKQRLQLRKTNRETLRAWFADHFVHPYPRNDEKRYLARKTGLTIVQVSNWFINTRVREWKHHVRAIAEAKEKGESATFDTILSRFKNME